MAHFQNQYSAPEVSQVHTDEFGNPIRRTDEYGNPNIPKHETDRRILGIGGQPHHGLHRTGSSSSSSSSEDEGTGRKKGLKQKLKEKLPGGHKDLHHQSQSASTTTPGEGPIYHQEERKGLMGKIKEKLPGHHNP